MSTRFRTWLGAVVISAALIVLLTIAACATSAVVTINQAATQYDPTPELPIHFTVVFDQPVEDFDDINDVLLSGTAIPLEYTITDSGDHTTYDVAVTGTDGYGTVIATVPAGAALNLGKPDVAGHRSLASTSTDNVVTYAEDTINPTCDVQAAAGQADPTFRSPILFTVVFDEPVFGFETGDAVLLGSAGATTADITDTGDHKTYTITVSGMTQSGDVTVEIPFDVAEDLAGNPNDAAMMPASVIFDMKPKVVMLLPSSGTLPTDTHMLVRNQFVDPDGASDIRICYTLISDANRSWANAVYLQYNSATGKVYLRNDANTSWGIGYALGTEVVLENSQVQVPVDDILVTPDGDYLTIDYRIKLKPSMASKNLWGWSFVQDFTGGYDGWIKSGEYNSNLNLFAHSVEPKEGALPIETEQRVAVHYYDANGFADINRTYLLINDNIGQTNAVYLTYVRATNRVYLRNDANTSWGTGYAPGTAVTLENSQCTVNVGAMTVAQYETYVSVTYWITLKPSMTGKLLNTWTYLVDNSAKIDPWKVLGVYYPQSAPVAGPDFIPTTTIQTGTPSIVAASWTDENGWENLERCYLLLTPQMGNIRYSLPTAQANAIYVRYNAYENKIYLKNDANTSWGTGYAPGDTATLSNSQGSIDIASSVITHPDVNTTRIELMVTPTWAATTTLGGWLQTRDAGGALSDWTPMTPQAPLTPLTVVP